MKIKTRTSIFSVDELGILRIIGPCDNVFEKYEDYFNLNILVANINLSIFTIYKNGPNSKYLYYNNVSNIKTSYLYFCKTILRTFILNN